MNGKWKIILFTLLLAGCQTAHIKTPEWEASINSHWFKRDVDKLSVQRLADGSYSVDLNGYKGDTSEQLPAFTREMWNGLAVLGRIAASATGAANAANVEVLPAANSNSQSGTTAECADGSCSK